MNWRELAAREAFHEFDWFHQPEEDLPEILELMREAVPKRRERNGMDERTRHLKRHEIEELERRKDPEIEGRNMEGLKAAALELQLGELEIAVEGDPEDATTSWARIKEEQRAHLSSLPDLPEVTEGEPTMSRAAYAEEALELIDAIESRFRRYLAADLSWVADEGGDEPPSHWLSEALSDVVLLAYGAGQRSRAAWGKEWEKDAVKYLIMVAPFKKANEDRRGRPRGETKQILLEISNLVSKGLSEREAAKRVFERRNLGSSAEANRQLYQKYKKEL